MACSAARPGRPGRGGLRRAAEAVAGLDPKLPLRDAHAKTHEVMRAIQDAFPAVQDVVIHTEPADGRELDASTIAPDD